MRSDSRATYPFQAGIRGVLRAAAVLPLLVPLAACSTARAQGSPPPRAADPAADAAIRIEKPLIDEVEEDQFRRTKASRYTVAVRKGDLKEPGQKEMIEEGIRWRVRRMTLQKHRTELPDRRREILALDLGSAGQGQPEPAATEFRKFMLQGFLDEAKKLLDNNYHVRLNAAILISQLSLVEAGAGRAARAFVPIADELLPLLGDPNQPVPVQIWAAKGLNRVLRTGDADDKLHHQIAMRIIAELKDKPRAHYWYQTRLVEILGGVKILHFGNDKAFAVDALAKIVVDRARHPLVRSEAAKQLGRVSLDGTVNVDLIAFAIVDLARDLVLDQSAAPRESHWSSCFFGVYLAYKPMDRSEESRQAGLLAKVRGQADLQKFKATVEESYDLLVVNEPKIVVIGIMQRPGTALDPKLADGLRDWLKQKRPSDLRIFPGLAPLIINADVAARPDPAN